MIHHCVKPIKRQITRMASSSVSGRKVFAISDLHVDIRENLSFVESWSSELYQNDVILVAGDLTDYMPLLKTTLQNIRSKFRQVFYVPGNHELWIRRETHSDSLVKFHSILEMCSQIDVSTQPDKVNDVWIVPLFSWYAKPEEDAADSLYHSAPRHLHEDSKLSEQVWMDNHLCKWDSISTTAAKYFSELNKSRVHTSYDAPVISFSHFVPRLDLVRQTDEDLAKVNKFRMSNHLGEAPNFQGGMKGFNFTRYAGSKRLEAEIRQLQSVIHVYGHQHRNRDRCMEGVRYVSHCLGNVKEQKEGWTWGIDQWNGPKQIWPNHT